MTALLIGCVSYKTFRRRAASRDVGYVIAVPRYCNETNSGPPKANFFSMSFHRSLRAEAALVRRIGRSAARRYTPYSFKGGYDG
jgi:hypothetical protein